MAVSVQQRGQRHQLRVVHKLLPRPFFHTFDTEPEARAYGDQLQGLLDRGVVPAELLATPARAADDPLLIEVVRAYTTGAPMTDSDDALLTTMLPELLGVRVSGITFAWSDAYVRQLKARQLAPGSIRKRVGVLARVIDWHLQRAAAPGQDQRQNPLRLLRPGYSTYSRTEAVELQLDVDQVPRDRARDRRLAPAELARIRQALAGVKRPGRQRALAVDADLALLLDLVLDTGLRLREAYTLRIEQIDLVRGVIAVEGTKGHRGTRKPRQVPIRPALAQQLQGYIEARQAGQVDPAGAGGLLLPFWSGKPEDLKRTTAGLSARFAVLFDYAEVTDCTEHDLRHEATCRWVELRTPAGGWVFSELEVCRIMGWTDPKMMLRYMSLRGEDLAARLRLAVV